MKIVFDKEEQSIVGYKEISSDFSQFDFFDRMVIEPGQAPSMQWELKMSGKNATKKT